MSYLIILASEHKHHHPTASNPKDTAHHEWIANIAVEVYFQFFIF